MEVSVKSCVIHAPVIYGYQHVNNNFLCQLCSCFYLMHRYLQLSIQIVQQIPGHKLTSGQIWKRNSLSTFIKNRSACLHLNSSQIYSSKFVRFLCSFQLNPFLKRIISFSVWPTYLILNNKDIKAENDSFLEDFILSARWIEILNRKN